MPENFLPISKKDLAVLGWAQLDIILISGDAYVDHPAYGVPLIGRFLASQGFKVGIIPQPDWKKTADFSALGRPRLFFGVSAGNVDSLVANYTANKKPRQDDDYSPGGKAGCRPVALRARRPDPRRTQRGRQGTSGLQTEQVQTTAMTNVDAYPFS